MSIDTFFIVLTAFPIVILFNILLLMIAIVVGTTFKRYETTARLFKLVYILFQVLILTLIVMGAIVVVTLFISN